ncbi:hypothetical protein WA026_010880 [Henosepilachna vigintioctopunctata]|uniref:HEAT repeat-containing protein 6 n=1 Tax=Henosepilachna vigintioctopunctata TaxID=420089 RepID=A0AAW1UX13_9CUCU
MTTLIDEREKFKALTSKIGHLFIERSEGDWKLLNKTLEDLNALNYKNALVENPIKAILLINQCCSNIPIDEELLIPKCCRLITNLITLQKIIVEGRTLNIAIQWCLKILSNVKKKESLNLDVLIALDSLLRHNSENIQPFISDIMSARGPILSMVETDKSTETLRYCLQCIESCTVIQENTSCEDNRHPHFEKCESIFTKHLCIPKNLKDITEMKIIIICLRGLENIVSQNSYVNSEKLGIVLGIIKSFMLLGIKNCNFLPPKLILPSALSIPEPSTGVNRLKKGGKITKQRKHRIPKKEGTRKSEEWMQCNLNLENESTSTSIDKYTVSKFCPFQLVTSDSDFSDTEANKSVNTSKLESRIRQISLSLFFTVAKNTEKNIMFSFWSSFIPENSLSGKHYLTTCILEDPSPKGRTAALNVLLYLLTTSKQYLSQAESSNRSTSFTPFSVILGYMIIELHHFLSLALSEKVLPVLAQVLKCYAALVQASPYHRLNAGLITKVVRSMKQLIHYKDPTIQVGALIVIGCILASEPVVAETKNLFLHSKNKESNEVSERNQPSTTNEEDFRYAEFSSDEEEEKSEFDTDNKTLPWILERCLKNLSVFTPDDVPDQAPAPVKLESVQVISSMCGNYFDCLIYPFLGPIGKALNDCLCCKYIDLKLHGGRAIDFIGQSMDQYLSGLGVCGDEMVTPGLTFWQTLINGSLTILLQSEQKAALRAVGCDCLGSIGSHIFERLPGDKQILCVTLLFACSRDEENIVRGSALRALGIIVLYPTLREDPGFVVDTAEAIYRSFLDENLSVRIKSSWSLGNLSDALVLNSVNEDLEEFPHSLLLRLLEKSVAACNDNDKIKMNVVRSIGNLLQLITSDLAGKRKFKDIVELAVDCLIRNATTGSNMKVRWNSCYAIGNALKNCALCSENSECLGKLFAVLNELVISFRNFKVRTNAALALSSPARRKFYGVHFVTTWRALLTALENSQNINDYSEYQHRDQLVIQICLTLGHLVTLLENDDLPCLHESLRLFFDTLKSQMKRVNETLIPEQSNKIFSAAVHLKTLGRSNLNIEGSEALTALKNVFIENF